jgi:hypothetical protein
VRQLGHREHVDQVEEQLNVGDPGGAAPLAQKVERRPRRCRRWLGADSTARTDRYDMTAAQDPNDSSENAENVEPAENSDPKDPTEPTDSAEPTDPIDSTDPRDPIDRNESCDHSDQRDGNGLLSALTAPPAEPPSDAPA